MVPRLTKTQVVQHERRSARPSDSCAWRGDGPRRILTSRPGSTRNYLGGIERGARNADLDNVHRIAAALEIGPEKLFESH